MIRATGSVSSTESPLTHSQETAGKSRATPVSSFCGTQAAPFPAREGGITQEPSSCCVCRLGELLRPFQEQGWPGGRRHLLGPCTQPTPCSVLEAGPSEVLQHQGGTRAGAKNTEHTLHPCGMGCSPWLLSVTAARGASCSRWPPPPAGLCHHVPTLLPSEGTAEHSFKPSAFSWY